MLSWWRQKWCRWCFLVVRTRCIVVSTVLLFLLLLLLFLEDPQDRFPHLDHVPGVFVGKLVDFPLVPARDFYRGLVGLYLTNRIKLANLLSLRDEPPQQFHLGDPFSDVCQQKGCRRSFGSRGRFLRWDGTDTTSSTSNGIFVLLPVTVVVVGQGRAETSLGQRC